MTTPSDAAPAERLLPNDPAREAEFDVYAERYDHLLNESLRLSGERGEYFTDYKIRDLARLWRSLGRGPGTVPENPRVLDFGAGVGASIPSFQQHLPAARLTCADVSARSLQLAERRFGTVATFALCAGAELPFATDSFDLAYAACVFHHIPAERHAGVLRELHRVVRPGGALMLYEHNPWNPVVVRVVRGCPFDERAILIPAPALRNKVREAGFTQVVTTHRVFFPRPLHALRWLEQWLGWLPLGAQYHVVGRK
ncbi:MAG: class I SAM-dependent methyltransferase [Planctomycetaceae bacterium]|jgi:ubiquinone/menaquinone biosynthesis C-methylase UbiE